MFGGRQTMRLFACDSEEEVAYLANQLTYRGILAGARPHVVIVDVLTAFALIAKTRRRSSSGNWAFGFELVCVLACVPWKMVHWPGRSQRADSPTLVPGFLGYNPRRALVHGHRQAAMRQPSPGAVAGGLMEWHTCEAIATKSRPDTDRSCRIASRSVAPAFCPSRMLHRPRSCSALAKTESLIAVRTGESQSPALPIACRTSSWREKD
jgi:hypothetical protein